MRKIGSNEKFGQKNPIKLELVKKTIVPYPVVLDMTIKQAL